MKYMLSMYSTDSKHKRYRVTERHRPGWTRSPRFDYAARSNSGNQRSTSFGSAVYRGCRISLRCVALAHFRHTESVACTAIVDHGANVRVEFSTSQRARSPVGLSYILNAEAKLQSGPLRTRPRLELWAALSASAFC